MHAVYASRRDWDIENVKVGFTPTIPQTPLGSAPWTGITKTSVTDHIGVRGIPPA
jgi:hypothetical protein